VHFIYSVSKNVAPKLFLQIFTQVKYISVKFCQFIPVYINALFTHFGRFILIFNRMAFIFPEILLVFAVSSLDFYQVNLPHDQQ